MAATGRQQGLHEAAHKFRATRNRVRQWLRRLLEEGKPGLEDRSRAAHHIPHKTPPEVEQQVLAARELIPCFGPLRLKQEFGLPCSRGAIARILPEPGRTRPRKKRRPPARSMAAETIQWPAFGLLQVDVKDLSDLPGYRELIPFGLPRYQSTARVAPEGVLWPAFSAVNDPPTPCCLPTGCWPTSGAVGWISPGSASRPTTAASSGGAGIAATACRPSAGWWSRNTAVVLTVSIPLTAAPSTVRLRWSPAPWPWSASQQFWVWQSRSPMIAELS